MNSAQKHSDVIKRELATRASQRLCKIIFLIERNESSGSFIKNELLKTASRFVPPIGGELDDSLDWFEFGKIYDPIGYQTGTLLAAAGEYKFVASLDSGGCLASLIAIDHVNRQGIILDSNQRVRSCISFNSKRNNAFFVHPDVGPLGDVGLDFPEGYMVIRKIEPQLQGFSAVRVRRHLIFKHGDHRLGSIKLAGRVSPTDCLITAWFALTDSVEEPKVV